MGCTSCFAVLQWRMKGSGNETKYYGVNPDTPYGGAKIVSVQPHLMKETLTGLNTTSFWITGIQARSSAIQYTVDLFCDHVQTPWCENATDAA